MDDAVLRALAKWPNVPACYGWLALDARGQWRLTDDIVRHAGLAAFLGRNYDHDEHGQWFCQNGPQRAYVDLAVTPWVLHLATDGSLLTHTGLAACQPHAAFLDDAGQLLIESEHGIGVVSDRDLPALLDRIVSPGGTAAGEAELLALMQGEPLPLRLQLPALSLPLQPIASASLPARFGFNPTPTA